MTGAALGALVSAAALAADWPEWGGDGAKNMVANEVVPNEFSPGEGRSEDEIEASAENLKWVAKLGSQTYGTPTIGAGLVIVGTNNEEPRNEKIQGDRGVVMCFDEKTGEFRWQMTTPKLGAGKVSDWEFLGMCSSALIDEESKSGYVVTNRGEIVAFDLGGMADGNDGDFQDEGKYMAAGLDGLDNATPVEVGDQDADLLWGFDMRGELGVFPHNVTSSSVATDGERIYASTSNGVDWSHINIPCSLPRGAGQRDRQAGGGRRIRHRRADPALQLVVAGIRRA